MLKGARGRRGFTLIETVVTVGIVAALAAVVYPQVVKQFDSTDPARAGEDLSNIATAISTFGINVRPQYPSDIEDLVNPPALTTVSGDSTSNGRLFSEAEQASWLGPYIGLSIPTTVGHKDTVLITGFGGRIINRIHPYDLTALTLSDGGDTVNLASTAADFLAVRIVGLSAASFYAINTLIDGPTETSFRRRSEGRFRCPFSGADPGDAPCPNAYFLAVPVR
jgi:prepilin-type N-terminal cleavage/methylation domain-containing protein